MTDVTLPKTPEELQKHVSDAVSAAVIAAVGDLTGLKAKNEELLTKLSDSNAKLKAFDGIDLEALKNASNELKELRKKQQEGSGDFKSLYNNLLADIEKERTVHGDAVKAAGDQVLAAKKELALVRHLVNENVVPELMDTAVQVLLPGMTMTEDGKAIFGSKPIKDYLKEWSASDVGKHFILSGKKGAGAFGADGSPSSAEIEGWFKKGTPTYNLTKQGELRKMNPAEYDRLKKIHG